MMLSDHQAAFTADLARLIRLVSLMMPGHRVRLDYAKRSTSEQERLVDAGISPTMNSQHRKRLAADLLLDRRTEDGWEYLRDTEAYRDLGEQWEMISLFNRWGGRWSDGNHFERLEEVRREQQPVYA